MFQLIALHKITIIRERFQTRFWYKKYKNWCQINQRHFRVKKFFRFEKVRVEKAITDRVLRLRTKFLLLLFSFRVEIRSCLQEIIFETINFSFKRNVCARAKVVLFSNRNCLQKNSFEPRMIFEPRFRNPTHDIT